MQPKSQGDVAPPSTADRLRAVALELFAEKGYAGTSLADIATRLGIRKPSLYNYYPSKEEIFLDLLRRSFDAWSTNSHSALDGQGSCRERLHRHLFTIVEFAIDNPHKTALCRVAVSHVGGSLERRVEAMIAEQARDHERRLTAFFSEAVERGEVVGVSVDLLLMAWQTFIDGILFHHLFTFDNRQSRYHAYLEDLWTLFWRGIAAETP
ncbi:MAG: TetR/AcrR family transcriptional regulator [Acidobacteriota bacterium]